MVLIERGFERTAARPRRARFGQRRHRTGAAQIVVVVHGSLASTPDPPGDDGQPTEQDGTAHADNDADDRPLGAIGQARVARRAAIAAAQRRRAGDGGDRHQGAGCAHLREGAAPGDGHDGRLDFLRCARDGDGRRARGDRRGTGCRRRWRRATF